jgi:hypothetical protein
MHLKVFQRNKKKKNGKITTTIFEVIFLTRVHLMWNNRYFVIFPTFIIVKELLMATFLEISACLIFLFGSYKFFIR